MAGFKIKPDGSIVRKAKQYKKAGKGISEQYKYPMGGKPKSGKGPRFKRAPGK